MIWQGAPDEDPPPLYGPGGPFNFGGYRSSALDALARRGPVAPARRARAGILATWRACWPTSSRCIYLYRYDVPALVGGRVRGLAAVGDRFDLRRAWLE